MIYPDTLRSVDARTFEELSVTKRTQTSRATSLENFSLNEAAEIMKAVTNYPGDLKFCAPHNRGRRGKAHLRTNSDRTG